MNNPPQPPPPPPRHDDITAGKINGAKISNVPQKKYFPVHLRNQDTRVWDIQRIIVVYILWDGYQTCGLVSILWQSGKIGNFHIFPQYGKQNLSFE